MSLAQTENIFERVTQRQTEPVISIIVAVFNQKDYLLTLHNDLEKLLETLKQRTEIIYVDDGSNDGSYHILLRLAENAAHIRVVKLRTSFGESSAMDAGLSVARGQKIIYFTSRVRINPKDLTNFIKRLEQGADVVMGVRHPRRDSWFNQIVSWAFNSLTNRMAKLKLQDINSGVIVTRREVLECVPFYGSLNTFLPVLAHRQGYKIEEENVEQLPGRFSHSMYPKNYIRRLLDLVSVIFLSKYSKKPLHFLGFVGAVFAISGAAIDLYLFAYRLLGFGGIAGRPLLLLGTLLLVIGVQMISIGLLGEMIIFTHAKNIREYNIEETIN